MKMNRYDKRSRQVERRLAETLEEKAVTLFERGSKSRTATRRRVQLIDSVDAIRRSPPRQTRGRKSDRTAG